MIQNLFSGASHRLGGGGNTEATSKGDDFTSQLWVRIWRMATQICAVVQLSHIVFTFISAQWLAQPGFNTLFAARKAFTILCVLKILA